MNQLWRAFIGIIFLTPGLCAYGKLLDRIVAVFNDQTITLSEVNRIQSNLKSRSGIARGLYPKKHYTFEEIIDKEIDIKTIRSRLNETGYFVNDDQVETMINRVEKEFRITRQHLRNELAVKNIFFEEYFELLRASREYNILLSTIVEPLVSITEQQIKNRFFNDNIGNRTLSISYSLVAYQISSSHLRKKDLSDFTKSLITYRLNGIIPKKYSSLDQINIGNVKDDDLEASIKNVLKQTNEGSFSKPIFNAHTYTVYYISKKDLVESNLYQKAKPKIHHAIFEEETKKILTVWLVRERDKHYVKKF